MPRTKKRPAARKKPRWGHLHELDRRIRVGTKTFDALPRRLKHLLAWRADHAVSDGHKPVHRYGKREGYLPSSDLPLRLKKRYVLNRDGANKSANKSRAKRTKKR